MMQPVAIAASPALAADNIALLRQTADVVRDLAGEAYTAPGPAAFPGGVGGHVRHIHDHYRLFLDGLPSGRVDYEARPRDTRIEQDRAFAVAALEALVPGLAAIPQALADAPITIQSACGLDDAKRWCRSTVRRELEFLVMHDVHHHALIAVMLDHRGLAVPAGFGLAPSTRRYLQGRNPCVQ